ncbi:hypothetical protein HYY69_08490 [Candidatus Woesearchaeota archaeon]|nr:hypothetical protein [Candidatus Woesearchaeota archaeon]
MSYEFTMKYEALIKAYTDNHDLYVLLLPELKNAQWERSSYTITQKKGYVEIAISARDSVALRATQNNVTKLLTVYEKLEAQHGNTRRKSSKTSDA